MLHLVWALVFHDVLVRLVLAVVANVVFSLGSRKNTCNLCFQQVRDIDVIARVGQEHLRTSGARVLVDAEQWGAGERRAGLHGRQSQVKALVRRLRAAAAWIITQSPSCSSGRQTWKWILPHNNVVCVTLEQKRNETNMFVWRCLHLNFLRHSMKVEG